MFLKKRRLRRIHARFLESCRNLKEAREYWQKGGGFKLWLARTLLQSPLLGLHPEGKQLLDALEWLEANCRQRPLSQDVIRHYHRTVCAHQPREAGEYRRHELHMGEKNPLRPPPPHKIGPLMKHLSQKLADTQEKLDGTSRPDPERVLEVAVDCYHRIGAIHPFPDANGRVARLSMNHRVRRYGLGYVVLPPLRESEQLWSRLLEAGKGDLRPLVEFSKTCVWSV